MTSDLILADTMDGIPHPGEKYPLVGHEQVISFLLRQFHENKIHHALLFSGPKGIGKVTLAMKLAGHILSKPHADQLDTVALALDPLDAVESKIAARAHPNLLHLTRPWDQKTKKFKTKLTVDEIRLTVPFFGKAKAEQGWRVAIVDSLDDMNVNASNALLKILEEPPERTIFFIIAHSLRSVLPTIRSRCQHLPLRPLENEQMLQVLSKLDVLDGLSPDETELLLELSEGSVRRAITLAREDGLELYKTFQSICQDLSIPNWEMIHSLADQVSQRGKDDKFRLFLNFANRYLRFKATDVDGSNNHISTLARWAEVWEKTQNSTQTSESFNLDRKQVILNLFHEMGEAVRTKA
ncbi:MAG: DNA polymerase III subunit delta' [Pseudomonadota bacterium]